MLLCNSWGSSLPEEVFPNLFLNTVVGREQPEGDGIPLWVPSCSPVSKEPVQDHTLLTACSSKGPQVGQGISTPFHLLWYHLKC